MQNSNALGIIGLFLIVLLGNALIAEAQTSLEQSSSLTQTLRGSQGRQRVLLVLAATTEQADFENQMALLATAKPGLAARDFQVLELTYAQLPAADRQLLIRRLGRLPVFAVVLIGKDGGIKLRRSRPVAPAELFALVDQMPMRRQEMRDQRPRRSQTSARP